jgi:hypothetical protein
MFLLPCEASRPGDRSASWIKIANEQKRTGERRRRPHVNPYMTSFARIVRAYPHAALDPLHIYACNDRGWQHLVTAVAHRTLHIGMMRSFGDALKGVL